MNSKRSFEPHLVIKEVALPAGSEWNPDSNGWSFLHFTRGVGYWLHPKGNHELATGSVLLFSQCAQGTIRASQVGEVILHCFRLQPERLMGLVTLSEQQFLQNAATVEHLALRVFPPEEPVASGFRTLCENSNGNPFSLRLRLLALFTQAFGQELPNQAPNVPALDAKSRLARLLSRTPVAELLDLSFGDLALELRCTPRHLSRIFHEVVGMSFRAKQTDVRLVRAQELLATTRCKVVEVALESGYQSLSLFNATFKKRFGVTPGKWREQVQNQKAGKANRGPLLALRT